MENPLRWLDRMGEVDGSQKHVVGAGGYAIVTNETFVNEVGSTATDLPIVRVQHALKRTLRTGSLEKEKGTHVREKPLHEGLNRNREDRMPFSLLQTTTKVLDGCAGYVRRKFNETCQETGDMRAENLPNFFCSLRQEISFDLKAVLHRVRFLSQHPNNANPYDIFEEILNRHISPLPRILVDHDENRFCMMESAGWGTVDAVLRHASALNEECLQALAWEVLLAVLYFSRAGIPHHDIKPANICVGLGRDGRVIARCIDISSYRHCSPYTAAPELFLGHQPLQRTPANDAYSLGCTLYHIFTRQNLLENVGMHEDLSTKNFAEIIDVLKKFWRTFDKNNVPAIYDAIPQPWKEIIQGLTVYDPKDRWSLEKCHTTLLRTANTSIMQGINNDLAFALVRTAFSGLWSFVEQVSNKEEGFIFPHHLGPLYRVFAHPFVVNQWEHLPADIDQLRLILHPKDKAAHISREDLVSAFEGIAPHLDTQHCLRYDSSQMIRQESGQVVKSMSASLWNSTAFVPKVESVPCNETSILIPVQIDNQSPPSKEGV